MTAVKEKRDAQMMDKLNHYLNRLVPQRVLCVLLIPLLLSMGLWGRFCLCAHMDSAELGGCQELALAHDSGPVGSCEDALDCDEEEDCGCFEEAPVVPAQFAETLPVQVQDDPWQLASLGQTIFANRRSTKLVAPFTGLIQGREAHARGAPQVKRPPLFVLFESYLC